MFLQQCAGDVGAGLQAQSDNNLRNKLGGSMIPSGHGQAAACQDVRCL